MGLTISHLEDCADFTDPTYFAAVKHLKGQ